MNLPDPRALASAYTLPPLLILEAKTPLEYQLMTSNGNFSLTILPPHTPLEGYYYQHWLLMALAEIGLSFIIPVPLRDQSGATLHPGENGEKWIITRCLTGQPIVPNDADNAYCMGAALAELHAALARIHPLPRPDGEVHPLLNLRHPIPHDPAELGLSDSKESQHRLQRFIEQARHYQGWLPEENLPWQIIHGSFYEHNLCYNGERVVGVLDFSEAHPNFRALEFASALLRVASDLGPMFWGTARAFVEGYAAFLRLSRAEIDLLPRLMVAMQVDRVLASAGKNPQQAAIALRIQEDISAWLESEQSRLVAMLRGVFLGE